MAKVRLITRKYVLPFNVLVRVSGVVDDPVEVELGSGHSFGRFRKVLRSEFIEKIKDCVVVYILYFVTQVVSILAYEAGAEQDVGKRLVKMSVFTGGEATGLQFAFLAVLKTPLYI